MPASQPFPEIRRPDCPTCQVPMWLVATAKDPVRVKDGHLSFRCPVCQTGAVIPELQAASATAELPN
jgi:RNase P subunit RPR2